MRPAPGAPRRWTGRRILLVAALALAGIGVAAWIPFRARLERLRDRTASGPSWSFPSRVWSADVPLAVGRPLPLPMLEAQLEARGYRRADGAPHAGTWDRRGDGATIHLRGFAGPDPDGPIAPGRVRVRIAGGRIVAAERLDGGDGAARLEPILLSLLMDEHRVRRTWVPLERIPRVVQDAVIAAEDRRFRRHMGLDLRSNFRALMANVAARGVREGGSTITQQLARGLFLGRERTVTRKLGEMALAVGLELALSKDEILEMYLNSVYWGQAPGGGVAGIAEAARHYFDLPPDSLELPEAALLAGLIPAPNALSPFRSERRARERRDAVLHDMVEVGRLDAAEAARVRARAPRTRRGPPPLERFPSFTGWLREELAREVSPDAVTHGGLAVFTTLDPVWQTRAEQTLAREVAALERWRGRMAEPLQGAFVAMDPATGGVRALVGGRGVGAGDFNRATQAMRQPGSAIKPIVYAAALDGERRGTRFTPASTVPDLRRAFDTPEGPWEPRNDEGDYHERVTLAKALAKSLNLATANLVEAIGPAEVARHAERFGLGRLKPVASIGLGSNEVTLVSLAAAYAVFPAGGIHRKATPLRGVIDARGRSVLERDRGRRALPEATARLMCGLLEDVVIFGVSYPLRSRFGFLQPLGGKTGTTNDYRDAWFVGFTPDVVAGTWVGYDTPQSLARPAADTALPVWAGVMRELIDGHPPTPFPGADQLELVWIDPWTGGLARAGCPTMRVPFLPGTAPREACRVFHAVAPDSAASDSAGTAAPADSVES
jgi:penicillin-binding protein 1B